MSVSGLYSTTVSLANSGYNCSSALILSSTSKVALFAKTVPSYCGKHLYKVGAGVAFAMLAGTFYKVFGKSIGEYVIKCGDKAGHYLSMDKSLKLGLQNLKGRGENGKKIAERS